MKEIHLPPILFLFQWIYNFIRWLFGYYTCEACRETKNVYRSKKCAIHSWSTLRDEKGKYDWVACNECSAKWL